MWFGARRWRLAKATAVKPIALQKPSATGGADQAWFDGFYKPDTREFRDRVESSSQAHTKSGRLSEWAKPRALCSRQPPRQPTLRIY